jgi:hypothetical protein
LIITATVVINIDAKVLNLSTETGHRLTKNTTEEIEVFE